MTPQLSRFRRQDRLRDMNQIAHQSLGLRTKREIDASLGTENVGDDGITTPLHALKQHRRPTVANHATMDLGELEVRINLGFDSDDFVFSVESIEKCAQARVHSSLYGLSAAFSTVRGRARTSAAGSPRRLSISSCAFSAASATYGWCDSRKGLTSSRVRASPMRASAFSNPALIRGALFARLRNG